MKNEDGGWTIRTLRKFSIQQIRNLEKYVARRFKDLEKRLDQRWSSDQTAISKVNEIRQVVSDLGNRIERMVSRDEMNTRITSVESLLKEAANTAKAATDGHFSINREKIEKNEAALGALSKDVTELKTKSGTVETGSQKIWERAGVIISLAVAIAALVSAFWNRK
jgi:hypothetical protein